MVILNFNTINSTNKYIIDMHDQLDDFTFVTAKEQTSGKGREERVWYSQNGENILASFLVKNPEYIDKFQLFSICTAVSIVKILEEIGVKNCSIKWPNDIYVNDKKICGILLQGELPNYFVVGFGLNVNQCTFEGEYRTAPTSIALELKSKQNIEKIKKMIFIDLLQMPKHLEEYIEFAQSRDYLKGKNLIINNDVVKCLGINKNAELVYIKDDLSYILRSGEVCIQK